MSLNVRTTDKGVGLALRRMVAILGPSGMQPIHKAIGSKLESNVHIGFDTKTDPDGKPWREWSEETKKAREDEGRGTLLEYTGRMRDSLTFIADNDGVEVGFGVEYAQWHEPHRHMLFSENGDLSEDFKNDALAAGMRAFKKQLKLQATQ